MPNNAMPIEYVVGYPVEGKLDYPELANRITKRAEDTKAEELGSIETHFFVAHFSVAHTSWLIKYTVKDLRHIDRVHSHLAQCEKHCRENR